MLRLIQDTLGRTGLDDRAVLHDEDLVGQRAHDPQIVADEQVGEAVAGLQFTQESSTICACTDMSSAEVGSSSTRNRGFSTNARAMAIRWRWPAGEFVRVALG